MTTEERDIVVDLISFLRAREFELVGVESEDSLTRTANIAAAVTAIEGSADTWLIVQKFGCGEQRILLIAGNGSDIVSDWTCYDDDRDKFDSAMHLFIRDSQAK